MALQAWWPLSGILDDYSMNNYTLTNNGSQINDNGKIGKCYVLNGNSQSLSINNQNISNIFKPKKSFSISVWVYFTGSDYQDNPICSIGLAGADTHLHLVRRNGILLVNHYSDDFNTGVTLSNNTWYHLTYTFDGKTRKQQVYINDILKESTRTGDLNVNSTVFYIGQYSSYNSQARFNDFRIYDHILSKKEIKEITKAKIMHYSFNSSDEEQTTNLYTNKNQITASMVTPTWINDHCVEFQSAGGTSGLHFNDKLLVTGGKTYTLSFKLQKINGTLICMRGHIDAAKFTNISYKINNIEQSKAFSSAVNLQDTYDIYKFEITYLASSTATNFYYNWLQPNFSNDTKVTVRIFDIQFEEKNHSTPFTSNSRNGLICDMSGYRNHILVNSSQAPIWDKESPIGSGSYKFDSSKNMNITENTLKLLSNQCTVSLWFKKFDNEHYQGVFQFNPNRIMRLMGFENGKMRFHPLGLTNNSPYIEFDYNINQWYNIVMIVDNLNASLYIDGIQKGSITLTQNISALTPQGIIIGRDQNDSSRVFNGLITDVRVYSSALSQEDVIELYKLKGSVANNGKLFVNEIKEQAGIINPSITKNSILNSSEINEIGFPIRYIRDYLNGSTANAYNHWCEIKAMSGNANLALNTIPFGSDAISNAHLITDGSTISNPYASCGTGKQYIEIDLNSVQHVDYIHIWHYYVDNRTYYETKTEVSIDGINWITIFDSSIDGTYQETSSGKKHYLLNNMLKLSTNGKTYANEFIEI